MKTGNSGESAFPVQTHWSELAALGAGRERLGSGRGQRMVDAASGPLFMPFFGAPWMVPLAAEGMLFG